MASYAMKITLERIALFQFTPAHCAQARAMLGWSVDELSRESGVLVDVIERFEARRDVPDADRLALAYRFESLWLLTRPDCRALRSVVTLFDELGRALKLP